MSVSRAEIECPVGQVGVPGQEPAADTRPEASGRVLGEALRRLRKDRGLALKDVAPVIRGSISKISRLERGESPPKERDVFDLARHYGVSAEQMREIDSLLQQSRSSAWFDQYGDVTPSWLRRLIDLEASAYEIHMYETHIVPGLLQTPAYARAVVKAGLPDAATAEVERRVALREGRQRILRSSQRPKVVAVLDEGVLRRPKGGPEVMLEQLRHLKRIDTEWGIHVRILEFEDGADVAPSYPITHLHFRDGGPPEIVYVELIDSALYVTKPTVVEHYRHVLAEVEGKSARWEDSVRILDDAIERYEKKILRPGRAAPGEF
ncbi:helix-turn-helix transcriptional regulator [Streptomyces sp. NPDC094034]|uniref:helix-turn-helix domain-containing protein n=1 Tax=Streptomyces sp. NPDC094034 TaxID=3155309 RepID=UPI0033293730